MPAAFILKGSSMLPVFKPGEAALVCGERPAPGDCAVYSYGGSTLLHRVLKAGVYGAWLADDAGRLEPHLVRWSDIRGRVLDARLLAGGRAGLLYSRCRRAFSRLLLNV